MAVPEPAEPRAGDERRPPKKSSWGLLVTLLVMAAGLVALFMFGFKDAAVYSVPVDKLLADQASVGKRVRIDGELVPGSLARRDQPCEYRFRVRAEGKELEIRYPQCVIPDTFRDMPQGGVMVTAEGKLLPAGHFEASLILAKCSSKYDPKTHQMDAPAASASPDAI
ncbi:MAG: cytochrome c maturation protein CcmE [Deltaproteobacteria bacterium]|nr:cytochrome c maturation protein CcmE [Deltaproteobacteria bacterium]